MKSYPLSTFFSLAYLISWVIWLPLYGHILGLGGLPTLPYHHAIGGLGPMVAAFITAWIVDRRAGVVDLLRRCWQWRPLLLLLIALISPFMLAFIAIAGNAIATGAPFVFSGLLSSKEFPEFNLLTFFIYNMVFFGFGEEVGWRGFALPRIQGRFNALNAALILTLFWALWHWPLFFYRPGYTSMDIAGILGWVFSLLTGSILLSWLHNSSRGSILICAIFHSTIDIAFTADLPDKSIVGYMGFLITVWGIMTIVVFKPRRLARGT